MAVYHRAMPVEALLPIEAEDMTVTELHNETVFRLFAALRATFGDDALVLQEIFVRVGGDTPATGVQVSPDLLIVPGAQRGTRSVYRVPAEPVPSVTIEVLSHANYYGEGRAALGRKRELLGRIGVPVHLELDPEKGSITVWENDGESLVPAGPPLDHYDGAALGGLRISLAPNHVRLWGADGTEVVDPNAAARVEAARADAATARADAEATRADAAAARVERLTELLRAQGVDPESWQPDC